MPSAPPWLLVEPPPQPSPPPQHHVQVLRLPAPHHGLDVAPQVACAVAGEVEEGQEVTVVPLGSFNSGRYVRKTHCCLFVTQQLISAYDIIDTSRRGGDRCKHTMLRSASCAARSAFSRCAASAWADRLAASAFSHSCSWTCSACAWVAASHCFNML